MLLLFLAAQKKKILFTRNISCSRHLNLFHNFQSPLLTKVNLFLWGGAYAVCSCLSSRSLWVVVLIVKHFQLKQVLRLLQRGRVLRTERYERLGCLQFTESSVCSVPLSIQQSFCDCLPWICESVCECIVLAAGSLYWLWRGWNYNLHNFMHS